MNDAVPVFSVSPVTVPAPGRAVDLQLRVSAPVVGGDLPIILLSHGQGRSNHLSSLNGYAPLASFWAAHGFVVLQPTHLSSKTLSGDSRVDPTGPEGPLFWQSRALDMTRILDNLDVLETQVPEVRGRLDRGRIAVVGHSMGGHTASLLLGATHRAPPVSFAEPRIKAGMLLAAPGRGDALSKLAAENYGFFSTIDFSTMATPALVVAGDKDASTHLTVAGPSWHADPYFLSQGKKSLLTLFGGEHCLGGISGYDVAETTDESPERVTAVQHLTWAYLRSALYPGDAAWATACAALTAAPTPPGRVEEKGYQ
ncbi:MAG: chlorophyllase [Polyangiaceae bacterium]|nr:chlorophyllase [Polyangiaceae bacterium]